MDQQTTTDRAARRASIAQAKATIATSQAAISQLRAHGAHPKNSVEGAERDVTIAQHDLAIAVARLDVVRIKAYDRAELPPATV
jgi:hypothetical protein